MFRGSFEDVSRHFAGVKGQRHFSPPVGNKLDLLSPSFRSALPPGAGAGFRFSLSGFNSCNRERLPVHQNPSRTAHASLLSPTSGTRLRVLSLTINDFDLSAVYLYLPRRGSIFFFLHRSDTVSKVLRPERVSLQPAGGIC